MGQLHKKYEYAHAHACRYIDRVLENHELIFPP